MVAAVPRLQGAFERLGRNPGRPMSFAEISGFSAPKRPAAAFKSIVRHLSRIFEPAGGRPTSVPFQLILACLTVASIPATVTPAFSAQNSIGTATLTLDTCQDTGMPNGTCYRVVISDCPEVTGDFGAEIKINDPPNLNFLQGTVFFTTGGGGNLYYDYDPAYLGSDRCPESNCGLMVVQSINSANYRTVQVDFVDPANLISEPVGWLTGPSVDGPRSLACRYATLVHAVWVVLLQSDTAHPVCATGNSGGGAALAYIITQYGMGNTSGPGPLFTMAEPTSGPPYGRIDHGCAGAAAPDSIVSCPAGDRISENYGFETAEELVDPAYPSDVCSVDIASDGRDADPSFYHDSVLSDDFPSPTYRTVVRALFGSEDLSESVPLGLEWYDAIKSSKSEACIAGAPHELPSNFDGATAIVDDVTTLCR
jgi:hypothetical protein